MLSITELWSVRTQGWCSVAWWTLQSGLPDLDVWWNVVVYHGMKHPDNIVNYISPDERRRVRVRSHIPFIFLCWSNSNSPLLISSSLSLSTAHGRLSLIDFIIQTCPPMNIACVLSISRILILIKCTNQLPLFICV